ncbi:diadenylate cyclase; DNA integrity scanning protein; cell cycle checkpoint DNA scanning protein [Candidatus Hydrogenisulfobacillus filiaventi]|uniref:Diadenylate cyclase DNA integrity scanning protein cell cycle checkpoint DNA scanning protein n=1 Tax=Candidatus Hydrogenisulfobacillus filiaventi TaxID=2707344 RepID=A0A6F8ZJP7_9FIRM|nr:DNA integrity scanning diadenylate cyclase DisA [Bacillota bacterium]CAB1129988.1 diadenylate cyclase; DNA integrity scanning protein; cell cycle checkpoint DNA scanning protein [Candidatus Hydrogenisulfobacillus filiaventi]
MSEEMLAALAKVAPGTGLREAIENILRAHTGALIVVGGEPDIDAIVNGGFRLDVPFQAGLVYELAKMDGAILLDADVRRIRAANVELLPAQTLLSNETGMRHRTAERVARSTDALVVAISQRRNLVSLYRGTERYLLHDLGYILTKANQALASLNRYDRLWHAAARRLTLAELQGPVPIREVVEVLHRLALVIRIREEIRGYVLELGDEGHLIDLQLEEFPPPGRAWEALWKDYAVDPEAPVPAPGPSRAWDPAEWERRLGYGGPDELAVPRGWRALQQVPRLPPALIERVVRHFGTLPRLRAAAPDELDRIEGIGPQRARLIWRELHEGAAETLTP